MWLVLPILSLSSLILSIVGCALSRRACFRVGAAPATKGHFMNLPTNTKPWIQGAVVGAIAATIIGFSWGGWVTGGSSDKRVAVAAHDATVTALASICAERFRAQPDAPAKLAELTKTSS